MKDHLLLEQKPLVDAFLAQGPRPLSSFSFLSVYAWCDFFDFEIKKMGKCLCIFAHGDAGCFLYLPPLGRGPDLPTIEGCFKHMARNNVSRPVHRVENIPENLLSAFSADRYNHFHKPAEYVYRKTDLIGLKGNAYKSQRHDCNHFAAHQKTRLFRPYADEDFNDCMALYDQWAANRADANADEIYRAMLQENRLVHGRLLKSWKLLGLVARVLKADGKMSGYTLGHPLDENTFCVYAEITDLKSTGAAAYMFRSFCADEELKNFSRINTMDDFAMPKVAQAKRAYHPSELIPSYTASLKTGSADEH